VRYFNRVMPEPLAQGLTPGDFAVVAHRARLLGEARPAILYDWLLAERDSRGTERGRLGFCSDGMA
jgi:transitional endoplasmic reticulum ATPase